VFALIGRIGEILLIMYIVRMIVSMLTPRARPSGPAPGGPRPRGPFGARQPQPERIGGQLVRCAQCGTYVPASNAINAPQSGAIAHFCSDKCRQEYAVAHP
jgi:hypothetical protein